MDENNRRLAAKARVECVMAIRNGKVVWDLHGLSIREWSQAGRYSSYRKLSIPANGPGTVPFLLPLIGAVTMNKNQLMGRFVPRGVTAL